MIAEAEMTEQARIEALREAYVAGYLRAARGPLDDGILAAQKLAAERWPLPRIPREITVGVTKYRIVDGALQYDRGQGWYMSPALYSPDLCRAIADLDANPYEL